MHYGFMVGSSRLTISYRQYNHKILFIKEANANNIQILKAILHRFESALDLRVDFAKCRIMGVKISSYFLRTTESFLHYSVGCLHFICLMMPVGANPCWELTWKRLIYCISIRLVLWTKKFDILSGRMVLPNFVLKYIHILYLLLLK
jgi:hypothetical protein